MTVVKPGAGAQSHPGAQMTQTCRFIGCYR